MSDTSEPISKRLRQRSSTTNSHASTSQQQSPSNHQPKSDPSYENAPPNSLLHLDDKCLIKLFEYLNAETLCHMANTCKRFRSTAEKVFADQYTDYKFSGIHSTSELRRVVCKFGKFITSFDVDDAIDSTDVDAIAKYCRPNLRKLSLRDTEIDCDVLKPIFRQLTDLSLDTCDFDGNPEDLFANCPKLEHLFYEPGTEVDNYNFLVRKFPKMDGLEIDCAYPSSEVVCPILKLNPQIKYLTLMAMADDHLIPLATQNSKNIERLCIRLNFMAKRPNEQTKSGLCKLAKLIKLTHLTMDVGYEAYAELIGPLVDAFSKANVPLEKLDLCDVSIGSKDIKSIGNLKTMKHLLLHELRNVNETDLISLTTNLPSLVELQLHIDFGIETVVTVNGLGKMIENAKQLEFLALVGIRNFRIDQTAFEELVKAVQIRTERIRINIFGCKTTTDFDVPDNVQQANAKRLKIMYTEDDDNRCGCKRCEEE